MGDGTYAEVVASSATISQALPERENPADMAADWGNFAGVNWAGGDFVTAVSGVNGQVIVALSASPLLPGESSIVNTTAAVVQPCAFEFAGSFVRTGISFATAVLFANDPVAGPDPVPPPINIVSCYQSSAMQGAAYSAAAGTAMTIVLESALPSVGANAAVFLGDWINITGLLDNRLCYPNACISYISPDRKTITVGFSDEVALPSLAVPVITPALGTAKVEFYNNFSGARNAFGIRFTGTTATSAAVASIFGGDANQVSGALTGDHRITISSSAPTYVAGGSWGQYEIKPTSRYMLECTPSISIVMDKAEQLHTYWSPRDTPRTSVKPSGAAALYPRFRLYMPANVSRPIAKIVQAEKLTASTTATIYTDVPHGLATGNYVTLKGIRDGSIRSHHGAGTGHGGGCNHLHCGDWHSGHCHQLRRLCVHCQRRKRPARHHWAGCAVCAIHCGKRRDMAAAGGVWHMGRAEFGRLREHPRCARRCGRCGSRYRWRMGGCTSCDHHADPAACLWHRFQSHLSCARYAVAHECGRRCHLAAYAAQPRYLRHFVEREPRTD